MKWVLPVAGGLYDQDPELLDYWLIIISEKAKHDKAEHDRMNKGKGRGGGGTLGGKKPAAPANIRGPKLAGRFNDGY